MKKQKAYFYASTSVVVFLFKKNTCSPESHFLSAKPCLSLSLRGALRIQRAGHRHLHAPG